MTDTMKIAKELDIPPSIAKALQSLVTAMRRERRYICVLAQMGPDRALPAGGERTARIVVLTDRGEGGEMP